MTSRNDRHTPPVSQSRRKIASSLAEWGFCVARRPAAAPARRSRRLALGKKAGAECLRATQPTAAGSVALYRTRPLWCANRWQTGRGLGLASSGRTFWTVSVESVRCSRVKCIGVNMELDMDRCEWHKWATNIVVVRVGLYWWCHVIHSDWWRLVTRRRQSQVAGDQSTVNYHAQTETS